MNLMPRFVLRTRTSADRDPAPARVAQISTSRTEHVPRAAPTIMPCAEAGTTATAPLLVPMQGTPPAAPPLVVAPALWGVTSRSHRRVRRARAATAGAAPVRRTATAPVV